MAIIQSGIILVKLFIAAGNLSFYTYVMRDFYLGILIFGGILWGIGLFMGAVIGFQKSLKTPPQTNKIEIQRLREAQEQRAENIKRQHKLFRDNYRQKMRDYKKL